MSEAITIIIIPRNSAQAQDVYARAMSAVIRFPSREEIAERWLSDLMERRGGLTASFRQLLASRLAKALMPPSTRFANRCRCTGRRTSRRSPTSRAPQVMALH